MTRQRTQRELDWNERRHGHAWMLALTGLVLTGATAGFAGWILTEEATVAVLTGENTDVEPEATVLASTLGAHRVDPTDVPARVAHRSVTRQAQPTSVATGSHSPRPASPFATSNSADEMLSLAPRHATPEARVARASAVLQQAGNPRQLPAMQVLIELAPESVETACLELASQADSPRTRSVVMSVVRDLARSPDVLSDVALTALYERSHPADQRVIALSQRRRSSDTLLQRFMAEQRERLESPLLDERLAATREIAAYGNLSHVDCLEPLFQDPDEQVRQAAMSCLLRFSSREERDEQLLRALTADPSAHIRKRAQHLIRELETRRQRTRAS